MAWWKIALRALGALVGLTVLLVSVWLLSSHGVMRAVLAWLERLGAWGYIVLAALFIPISTPFGYGYTAIGFTCGALYGVWRGTAVMVAGADGGAILAFVAIRYLFKEWFRDWLVSKRRLRLLMRAVDVNATKFAFLSRFTPIPWGIQNTIYAVSDLELWKFAILTSLGGFPDQLIIAFMGSQVQVMLIAEGHVQMGPSKWIMLGLELLACLALAILMIIFAKRAIDQTNAEEDQRAAAAIQRAQADQANDAVPASAGTGITESSGGVATAPAVPATEEEKHPLLLPIPLTLPGDADEPAVAPACHVAIELKELSAAPQASDNPDAQAGAVMDDLPV
jgi:protein maelstrom